MTHKTLTTQTLWLHPVTSSSGITGRPSLGQPRLLVQPSLVITAGPLQCCGWCWAPFLLDHCMTLGFLFCLLATMPGMQAQPFLFFCGLPYFACFHWFSNRNLALTPYPTRFRHGGPRGAEIGHSATSSKMLHLIVATMHLSIHHFLIHPPQSLARFQSPPPPPCTCIGGKDQTGLWCRTSGNGAQPINGRVVLSADSERAQAQPADTHSRHHSWARASGNRCHLSSFLPELLAKARREVQAAGSARGGRTAYLTLLTYAAVPH